MTRPKLGPDTYVTAVIAFEFSTFNTSKLRLSERREPYVFRNAVIGIITKPSFDCPKTDPIVLATPMTV